VLSGLREVRGVFTSTATVVIEAIEEGGSIEDGIARAQRLGIAEADPTHDLDGLDTMVKLCAIARVLFGVELLPLDVPRVGVRELIPSELRAARDAGTPFRLVGRVAMDRVGAVTAQVKPERITPHDPLYAARGTTLVMHYEADVFPGGLTVTSHDPSTMTTAYGMFTDFLTAIGSS
jgi:homoserine dehydrogenase